jgi:predicted dienelactone hydrolase
MKAVVAAGRTLRRAVSIGLVTVLVAVGTVAHGAVYLSGFTVPNTSTDPAEYEGLGYASPGAHPVGVRRVAPETTALDLTVWYPASTRAGTDPPMTYSYALTVLDPRFSTALATFEGRAVLDAAPDARGGPYPLVVLSSGFAITPESYAWLAEHLASYGMVVVAPRHAETLDPRNLWRAAIDRPDVIERTREYLATVGPAPGDWTEVVDTETVAVVGHSYGGYTALASGGARLDSEAFAGNCTAARASDDPLVFLCDALEPRMNDMLRRAAPADSAARLPVDAVVSLAGDAAMFGEKGLAAVHSPLLVMGGTADRDSPFRWSSQLAYDNVSSDHKVEVALDGAEHFVFAGQCDSVRRIMIVVHVGFCADPAWDRNRAQAVISHYVTGFLLAELLGEVKAHAELASTRQVLRGVGFRATGY